MKVRLECTYGFYHGQDPRTFSPDPECCTPEEKERHKAACAESELGEWKPDDSGCHHVQLGASEAIVCKTSMGIGTYYAVLSEDGDYVRDANWDDLNRRTEYWDEEET